MIVEQVSQWLQLYDMTWHVLKANHHACTDHVYNGVEQCGPYSNDLK